MLTIQAGGFLATSDDAGTLDRHTLETKLKSLWSVVLGLPVAGIHDEFFFLLGGDDDKARILAARIEAELKVRCRLQDLQEASTISKLTDLIELRRCAGEEQCIVPIRPAGTRTPLYVVHGIGGNVLGFAELARVLHPEQPVYGIQAQALSGTGPTLLRLEEMARFYIGQIKRVQPEGPYSFLGLCFGGLVAYEIAQQLVAEGERVQFLGLLDTRQPGFEKEILTMKTLPSLAWKRLRQIRRHTRKLSLRQWPPYVHTRIKSRALRVMYRRMKTSTRTGVSLPDSMRRAKDINLSAAARYKIRPFAGKVTLFRAMEDASYLPEDFRWREFALGGVDVVRLPGDHGQMLAEPSISAMAAKIEDGLVRRSVSSVDCPRDVFELDIQEDDQAAGDEVTESAQPDLLRGIRATAARASDAKCIPVQQKAG